MKLTEHFTLDEFCCSQTAARCGIDNTPRGADLENLRKTAMSMEHVRVLLGNKPILISSGYRCSEVNRMCGGSKSSAHMLGYAVDFTCPGFGTPLEICMELQKHNYVLAYDQLIWEYGSWVHIAWSDRVPRRMSLTIDCKGTRDGFA